MRTGMLMGYLRVATIVANHSRAGLRKQTTTNWRPSALPRPMGASRFLFEFFDDAPVAFGRPAFEVERGRLFLEQGGNGEPALTAVVGLAIQFLRLCGRAAFAR